MIARLTKWGAWIVASVIGLAVIVLVLESIAVSRIEQGYGEGREQTENSLGADRTPQWSSDGGVIVLNLEQRLLAFNSDGRRRWTIAYSRAGSDRSSPVYHSPSVAADGRIAYQRSQYETGIFGLGSTRFQLYVETANLDGSDVEIIQEIDSNGVLPIIPVWSPDGSSLAFITQTSEDKWNDYEARFEYEIKRWVVVVGRSGEVISRIPVPGFNLYDSNERIIKNTLVWSNDGQRIAVVATGRVQQIVTMRKDGSEQMSVAATFNRLSLPGWSPSDERLYYAQKQGTTNTDRSTLYSVKNDGSDRRNLADLGGNLFIRSVKPSPDGDKLLLIDSSNGVYIFGIDGTGLTHIPDGKYASWAPDGKRVAVYTNGDRGHLVTVAEDGSDVRILLRGIGIYRDPLPYAASSDKTTS